MICKHCGTESNANKCPYCGASFFEEESTSSAPVPQAPVQRAPQAPTPKKEEPIAPEAAELPPFLEQTAKIDEPRESGGKKKKKKPESAPAKPKPVSEKPQRLRREPIRFKKLLFPALMFFLPIAYFFVDIYARLSDALFAVDGQGSTLLHLLATRLTSAEYAQNSLRDIEILTLGSEGQLFRAVSFATRGAAGDMRIPLWIVLGFAVASALMGALLLCSRGKLLRFRIFADLAALAGLGAAFSPLLGLFCRRCYYCAVGGLSHADATALQATLSVESLMLIGISLCVLLPAVAAVRRMSARANAERYSVLCACRAIGGRSFAATRNLCVTCVVLLLCVVFFSMLAPVLVSGSMIEYTKAIGILKEESAAFGSSLLSAFFGGSAEVDFSAFLNVLLQIVFFTLLPLAAIFCFFLLLSLWHLLGASKERLVNKRKLRRALARTGRWGRLSVLAVYIAYTAVQIFLVPLSLFGTKALVHFDVTNVEGTLSLLYVIMAYVKSLCGTNTLYALLALGGAFLWHLAGNLARKTVMFSYNTSGVA